MADSNPFANLGQGFLGADASIARSAATPNPIFSTNPIKMLLAGGLDKLGVTDFLNSLGGSQDQGQTNAPIAPPTGTGINPVTMGVQPPDGLGLQNKENKEGLNPAGFTYQGFGGKGAYSLPDFSIQGQQSDTHSQIKNAWGQ